MALCAGVGLSLDRRFTGPTVLREERQISDKFTRPRPHKRAAHSSSNQESSRES